MSDVISCSTEDSVSKELLTPTDSGGSPMSERADDFGFPQDRQTWDGCQHQVRALV